MYRWMPRPCLRGEPTAKRKKHGPELFICFCSFFCGLETEHLALWAENAICGKPRMEKPRKATYPGLA